jgi:shikimate dehydrogenase
MTGQKAWWIMGYMGVDLYGILGCPVGHSISPAFHSRAFALKGVAGVYLAWEKREEELPDFFHAVRSLPVAGLSVTIPYKSKVPRFLDDLTDRARLTGAVNTVFRREGRLVGGNSDVDGLLMPLARRSGPPPREALVLGAGGAARAVLAGLAELGLPKVGVAARDRGKAEELIAAFARKGKATAYRALAWEERSEALAGMEAALVINATPLGMKGAFEGQSPLPDEAFDLLARREREKPGAAKDGELRGVFFDLVYAPRETRFLAAARERRFECIDGLAFFAAQAVGQFMAWTGKELALREAEEILVQLPGS